MQGVKSKNLNFCVLKQFGGLQAVKENFHVKIMLMFPAYTVLYVNLLCLPSTSPAVSASNTLTPWFYAQTAVIVL